MSSLQWLIEIVRHAPAWVWALLAALNAIVTAVERLGRPH
jgi:hypothetical protein